MNYKRHSYPTTIEVLQQCTSIASEFDQQLNNDKNKICLKDIYKLQGTKCTADRNLLRSKFNCNSLNAKYPNKEIKGVYVLVDALDNKPFYVGISQTIIRRLKQHVLGKSNNHATLVYLMAKYEFEQKNKTLHIGTRSQFLYFDTQREIIQERLRDSTVMIKEIDNNFTLYAVEVYLACHYKAFWNCFETH